MKKKSIIARVGVMAAALTLATTSLMSGTMAKYTTNAEGVAEAIVANWGGKITSGSTGLSTTSKIFLTKTSMTNFEAEVGGSGDAYKTVDTVKVNADGTVSDSGTVTCYKLAPGMNGSFPVTIDMSNSEIDTDYTIDIKLNDNSGSMPTHLVFTYEDSDGQTQELDSVALASGETVASGRIKSKGHLGSGETQKKTVNVSWKWPYTDPAHKDGSTDSDKAAVKTWDAQDNADMTTIKSESFKPIVLDVTVTAQQADLTINPAPAAP